MKKQLSIFCLLSVMMACGQPNSKLDNKREKTGSENNYKIATYQYDSLSIPAFFKTLISNHTNDYRQFDSLEYNEFCNTNDLKIVDSANIEKFYSLRILHDLFTSKTARDGSRGDIINIPYQWHWVEPNPRHEIYFLRTNKLLCQCKPPKQFSQYASFADIDRTPSLFLSDLFSGEPQYYSASCDTFSTFGWCSEREMAFVCLARFFNDRGKVVASGNHSWSEFIIPFNSINNKPAYFLVEVDNTFDHLYFTPKKENEIASWQKDMGSGKMPQWYNQQAMSASEFRQLKQFIASPKALSRIELSLVKYLERKIN